MQEKITRLPKDTEEVLKLASCIGENFDLKTLSVIYKKSQFDTLDSLIPAIEESLIIPIDENYKLISISEREGVQFESRFEFIHNRIHQACYYLVPEKDKQVIHLQIGRLIIDNTPEEEIEEKIFDIVNHTNIGFELLEKQSELEKLARLNLLAARKAKHSTAYLAAYNYLAIARKLLRDNPWRYLYRLTQAIYVESAEIAYLNSYFEEMEDFVSEVKKNS